MIKFKVDFSHYTSEGKRVSRTKEMIISEEMLRDFIVSICSYLEFFDYMEESCDELELSRIHDIEPYSQEYNDFYNSMIDFLCQWVLERAERGEQGKYQEFSDYWNDGIDSVEYMKV